LTLREEPIVVEAWWIPELVLEKRKAPATRIQTLVHPAHILVAILTALSQPDNWFGTWRFSEYVDNTL
jgi:hypothetical protein